MYKFEDLVKIMEKLRSPEGCPWDRKQTHDSLIPYLVEEVHEFIDAVSTGDYENMKEELGDILLQVVFHSQIAKENSAFTIDDVVNGICQKLINRHPHVFGKKKLKTAEDVEKHWDELKKKEGKDRKSALDGIPRSLPPINRALELGKKAQKVGFDWVDEESLFKKVEEELREVKQARSREELEEEIGDLLFMVVNLSRFFGVDPNVALSKANEKFERRFRQLEEVAGDKLKDMNLEELESIWKEVKKKGKTQ